MNNKLPIIVIGKNYSTSLGVIRALGIVGYKIDVVKLSNQRKNKKTPELFSKYVEHFEYVKATDEQKILKVLLSKMAEREQKKIIIPSDDFCASLLDKNYGELQKYFIIPIIKNKPGELTRCMDKYLQKAIAFKCGLNVADGCTIVIDSEGNYKVPGSLKYPCFAKPQKSIGSPKSYIRKCHDFDELCKLLSEISYHGQNEILIEEYLEIENEYVIPGVSCQGHTVIPAVIKKLIIGSGEHKGVTAKGVIISADKVSTLISQVIDFVSSFKLSGLFDIEIIECKGKYYFNELNLRNGAAGYAITAAGVNLPSILVDYMINGTLPEKNYTIFSEHTFISEKVELEAYLAGFITWNEYKAEIKSADIRFMKNQNDLKPFVAYSVLVVKSRIRKFVSVCLEALRWKKGKLLK